MKFTPLREQHIRLRARMGEFGGWNMPIQYSGILKEHQHTRKKATLFDICHMGEFELVGPSAEADLEHLLTCNIQSLKVGQVRYGFMLNDEGGVIDDLTCYRMDKDRYMLVVNAGTTPADAEWIKSKISAETTFADLSPEIAKLDFQGPESRNVLEDVLECTLPDLGYFRFKEFEAVHASCILSRTGYTGEWGYEIYLPNDAAVALWDKILQHESSEPGGLGARDTLRLEMGYPLYGHELSADQTPVATSRGAFIDLSKDFIGKERVQADMENSNIFLVGLKFNSKRAAREHDKVFHDNVEIGEVTSGSVAPSLDTAVAMAFVRVGFEDCGRILDVEIRGKHFPAEVVELPFYKNGTARG